MGGDNKLHLWEALRQPETNALLPSWVQVSINFINEHHTGNDNFIGASRNCQGINPKSEDELVDQFDGNAQSGAVAVTELLNFDNVSGAIFEENFIFIYLMKNSIVGKKFF